MMSASKLVLFAFLFCMCGCQPATDRKATFPVTGVVYVDGEPADMLAVKANPIGGMDQVQPTVSSAFTDADGKFSFSTYETGDGIPAGEYKLTFLWGEMNLVSMQYGGPDKLKNRYEDIGKSKVAFRAGEGEEISLGRIDLKTK